MVQRRMDWHGFLGMQGVALPYQKLGVVNAQSTVSLRLGGDKTLVPATPAQGIAGLGIPFLHFRNS